MRVFNSSGPCDPARHYTVMREALVAEGQQLVDAGRYFTVFSPRQAGKTTWFQLLFRQLQEQGYLPLWISLEGLTSLASEEFYYALAHFLRRELALEDIELTDSFTNAFQLQLFFEKLHEKVERLVLVIDEFEAIPEAVVSEFLHTLRALYHKRQFHPLHSLMLVGVSSLAELVVSQASPFNVVDQLQIAYFTFAEVDNLIQQHTRESGQVFEPDVIQAIYDNTQGQPGLVCALCEHLVTKVVPDFSQPVGMEHFYLTLKHFLTERFDKNILNIVRKAREKPDFMLRILFDETPIPFTLNEPDIAYLYAHGVIDNVDGYAQTSVPLYSKALITAFRPLLNGETEHFIVSAHETLTEYVTPTGLNIHGLLTKYQEYVRRRGFHAFNTEQLKESAWHYSLEGFLYFFIEQLKGEIFVEVPSGRGRTDLLILYQQQKYVIETKIFRSPLQYEKGKAQLADYLTSEGLSEGYYVVFSHKHSDEDTLYFAETVAGKRIHIYIIRANLQPPSRR